MPNPPPPPAETKFQNETERFVFELCRKTFLSLWSYANPQRPNGKELCDVLILCEPDVVLISVREVELAEDAEDGVAQTRWFRKAVLESANQICVASQRLVRLTHVIRSDGSLGLPLPSVEERRIHRVAVSLGGSGHVPLVSGDLGKGYVHVFDERSFSLAIQALDTITDFVAYLRAKEDLAARVQSLVVDGGEENLLAVYLHRGKRFPMDTEHICIPDGLWQAFVRNPAVQRKRDADRVSYVWDQTIEYFSRHALAGSFEIGNELSSDERALRVMARENRFMRRALADSLVEFLILAKQHKVSSRMCRSDSGFVYVFLNSPPSRSRDLRFKALHLRCYVARARNPDSTTVIGLGINVEPAAEGYAEDIVYFHLPEWTDAHQQQADLIQQELGYFTTPEVTRESIDEYPPP